MRPIKSSSSLSPVPHNKPAALEAGGIRRLRPNRSQPTPCTCEHQQGARHLWRPTKRPGVWISVRLEPVPVPESEPRDPPPQGECLYPWSLAPREAISLSHTCYTGPHVTLLLLSALCPQDPTLPLLWLIVTIRTMKTLTKTTGLGQLPLSRQTSRGRQPRLGEALPWKTQTQKYITPLDGTPCIHTLAEALPLHPYMGVPVRERGAALPAWQALLQESLR